MSPALLPVLSQVHLRHNPHLLIHFNFVPSTPRSSEWSLHCKFYNVTSVYILPMPGTCPAHLTSLIFKNVERGTSRETLQYALLSFRSKIFAQGPCQKGAQLISNIFSLWRSNWSIYWLSDIPRIKKNKKENETKLSRTS